MPGIFRGALKGITGGSGGTFRHFVSSFGLPVNLVYLALIAIVLVVVIVLAALTVREYVLLKKK